MCKVGDIILINNYKHGNKNLSHHSFVVMNDEAGKISGLSYDMICNVLSSYKNEEQKKRKLSYPGNFPVVNEDTVTNPDNGKNGFLKTEQLYYFAKDKIEYAVIGYVKPEIFDLIVEYIEESKAPIEIITDNL